MSDTNVSYAACDKGCVRLTLDTYEFPEIPPAISEMLQGLQLQSDIVFGLAVAAAGFFVSQLLRMSEKKGITTRKKGWIGLLLGLSLITLFSSAFFGYMLGAYRTGYFIEIATGWNGTLECWIVDAREHFRLEYLETLQDQMKWQLLTFCVGIVAGILALLGAISALNRSDQGGSP